MNVSPVTRTLPFCRVSSICRMPVDRLTDISSLVTKLPMDHATGHDPPIVGGDESWGWTEWV